VSVLKSLGVLLSTPRLLMQKNAVDYYQFLGDDVVEGYGDRFADPNKPLWLNLGYWKKARRYPDAASDMARLVADSVRLGPDDHLLDVGFGFGEQDFLWIAEYGVRRISGLNITPLHVERANQRARERGLADRVDLRIGSATEMPFEDSTFDKLTALECAFHFDTREDFFREAFRVLKPGGRLAAADGARETGEGPLTFVNRVNLKRWSVPLANMYDSDEYCRRLEAHGFVNTRYESIRNHVFPGSVKYRKLREKDVSMKDAVIELTQDEIDSCYGLEGWKLTGFTDYVIFTADKPA